jgi:hypothetical protein
MSAHTYSVEFDGAVLDEVFDAETDDEARAEFSGLVTATERDAEDTVVGELVMRDETGREIARHLFY